jgi:hypothetical protein
MSLTVALLVVVVCALGLGLLVVWDRLVGMALVAVVSGATWMVGQSAGRWWFWPAVVLATLGVTAAFVVAVLIS